MNSAPSDEPDEAIAGANRSIVSNSPASERDRRQEKEDSSCASSSSDSEAEREEPPRKKQKRNSQVTVDPRIDALYNQVSFLTNFIMHQQYAPNTNENTSDVNEQARVMNNDFLTNPSTETPRSLDLGACKTNFDEKKVLKSADEKRLRQLISLQHFNTPTWQHIRYKKALMEMLAYPGFCNLKINDELCCLNKGKDFLASTEEIMAATTNALLLQRELLQSGLQSIIDWAHNNAAELRSDNLFNIISETFGNESQSYKLSEQTLQIICGKRAECIETRRKRIILEISDKRIQAALTNIPPSEEFLFDKAKLIAFIQTLGGPHFWLSPQASKTRVQPKTAYKDPTPSTSKYRPQTQNFKNDNFRETYKKRQTKQTYKGKSDGYKQTKNYSFRNKDSKK